MLKRILNLTKYLTWAHEIFHWLPAKILNVPIRVYPDRVYHEIVNERWKTVVIVSGPLIAGLFIFGGVLILVGQGLEKTWLIPAAFFIGSSIWDIRDLIHYFRTGKWKEEQDE